MRYEERVPDELIIDNHYIGRPADFNDRIIQKRIKLVKNIPNFIGKELDLLEIGCGNGASMLLLAESMKSCLGIEIFEGNKEEFEGLKKKLNINNCEFRIFNIETEKMDKKFDRIMSFEVIEHLKDENNVKAYYELLKPGGLAAISVPNKWWIFETHGARLPLLPWNRVPLFSWLPRQIHEKFAKARIYTKRRIKRLLENTGFKVNSIMYITAPLDVLKEGKLKSFLLKNIFKGETTKIPFLSTSIFIVAEK
jgi:2-polyprenyl-3-methyl-5-hydroxy-6-metoxy-1,4-benzoquinol methylase